MGNTGGSKLNNVLRGGLKPKPKEAFSVKKTVRHVLKTMSKQLNDYIKANSLSAKQSWYDTIPKRILPSRVDVYNSHIEFNRRVLARSYILGHPIGNMPNLPSGMTANTFTQLMTLGGHKNCHLMLSTAICKKSPLITTKELDNAWNDNAVEEQKDREYNPAGAVNLGREKMKIEIRTRFNDVWDRNQNEFYVQSIFTMKGGEKEILETESKVISLLGSARIGNFVPEHLQEEAFVAASPIPNTDHRFLLEAPSEIAAKMAAMTSINTKYDNFGLLFGKNRYTNADVLKDLAKLGAKHLIMYGATFSGKTYTAMLLLMRLYYLLNYRIIYITRKPPDRKTGMVTDYENVAKFFKEESETIVLGSRKSSRCINPLQVIYDEKTTNEGDYDDLWDNHRITISEFIKNWFKGDYSPNMESMLEDALDHVYTTKGIFRDKPETWKRRFPTIPDLRQFWFDFMRDTQHNMYEDRRAAGALYRKTRNAMPGRSMAYLLGDEKGQTNFDLSKDWISIDLSHVDKRIRDALYILITSGLSSRFNTDPSRETVIFVDEARAFLRNPELCNFLLDTLTMGRSQGVSLWLATQQPADLKKANVEEEFSTNMFMAIVMGYKMKPKAAKYVQTYFGLSDSTVEDLLTCNQGEGILMVDDEITPIWFKPSVVEDLVIKDEYVQSKPEPISAWKLKACYLAKDKEGNTFIDRNRVFTKEMLELGDESSVMADGWLKWPVTRVDMPGSTVMFYKAGDIDPDKMHMSIPHMGDMTIDHYASVIQQEAVAWDEGFRARSNHTGGVDNEYEYDYPDGTTGYFASEYEEAGSHTKEGLNAKWGNLLNYDAGKIFCSSSDYKIIVSAFKAEDGTNPGLSYVDKRGQNFLKWLRSLKVKPTTAGVSEENQIQKSTDSENEGVKEDKPATAGFSEPLENTEIEDSEPQLEEDELKEFYDFDLEAELKKVLEDSTPVDAFNEGFLVTEEDIVGQALYDNCFNGLAIKVIELKLSPIQVKRFKRNLSKTFLKERPEEAKVMYWDACKALGGRPETDLNLESEPVIAG